MNVSRKNQPIQYNTKRLRRLRRVLKNEVKVEVLREMRKEFASLSKDTIGIIETRVDDIIETKISETMDYYWKEFDRKATAQERMAISLQNQAFQQTHINEMMRDDVKKDLTNCKRQMTEDLHILAEKVARPNVVIRLGKSTAGLFRDVIFLIISNLTILVEKILALPSQLLNKNNSPETTVQTPFTQSFITLRSVREKRQDNRNEETKHRDNIDKLKKKIGKGNNQNIPSQNVDSQNATNQDVGSPSEENQNIAAQNIGNYDSSLDDECSLDGSSIFDDDISDRGKTR